VIAVAAGEAQRPEESIPRAMRTIVFRLIIFYVLAITIMLAMTPWNQPEAPALPAVLLCAPLRPPEYLLQQHHEPGGDNGCPLQANTNLYLSTRMLFSLSRGTTHLDGWIASAGTACRTARLHFQPRG